MVVVVGIRFETGSDGGRSTSLATIMLDSKLYFLDGIYRVLEKPKQLECQKLGTVLHG